MEASFFTLDQLEMIADFVGQRGGSLLTLGGRNAFAEGGFAGTPLEEVYPVVLGPPASDPIDAFTEIKVTPTVQGRLHPAVQIRPGGASDAAWDSLPPLSTLNRLTEVKPGATVLLQGATPSGEERVVLAHQRYGRGTSIAFAVQDSWMWQMHYDVPLEDQTHENLWTQLLRYLL